MNAAPRSFRLPSQQRGLSLMESMIAFLVLSIGLLGIAGLQLSALRATNSANYRAIASIKAAELADRMRVNLLGVYRGSYLTSSLWDCSAPPPTCVSVAKSANCSVDQMADFDLYQVSCVNGISDLLPNGTLDVTCADVDTSDSDACSVNSLSTITIGWQTNADVEEDANKTSQLVTTVILGFDEE